VGKGGGVEAMKNISTISICSLQFSRETGSSIIISVAKGPKILPQNTKEVEKNCVGPEKSEAELLADL
jgi:hypothetical protein